MKSEGNATNVGNITSTPALSPWPPEVSSLYDKGLGLYYQDNYAQAIQYYDKALTYRSK